MLKKKTKTGKLYLLPGATSSRVAEAGAAMAEPVSKPVSMRRVRSLGEQYEITSRDFAEFLEVTPKTLTRWNRNGDSLSRQQSDRIAVLEAIFALGGRVLGSREHVREWLRNPVLYLNDETPLELLKTESGRRRVENALRQIEFGMY